MKHVPMETFFPYELILLGSNQQPDWIFFFPINIANIGEFSKDSQNKTQLSFRNQFWMQEQVFACSKG